MHSCHAGIGRPKSDGEQQQNMTAATAATPMASAPRDDATVDNSDFNRQATALDRFGSFSGSGVLTFIWLTMLPPSGLDFAQRSTFSRPEVVRVLDEANVVFDPRGPHRSRRQCSTSMLESEIRTVFSPINVMAGTGLVLRTYWKRRVFVLWPALATKTLTAGLCQQSVSLISKSKPARSWTSPSTCVKHGL